MSQMMEEIKLELSKPQVQKLATGGSINVKPEMSGGSISLYLDKKKARKVKRALAKGKGARLSMHAGEIEGSGLWDVLKGAWNVIKKVVPVRQVATNIAKEALPALAGKLGGQKARDVVQGVTDKYAEGAVGAVGDVAGFGVRARGVRAKGVRAKGVRAKGVKGAGEGALVQVPAGGAVEGGMIEGGMCGHCGAGLSGGAIKGARKKKPATTSSSGSFFMAPTSAAMNPPSDAVPPSGAWRSGIWSGGSGLLPPGMRR